MLGAGTALAAVVVLREADRRCSTAQAELGFCAIMRAPQPPVDVAVTSAPSAPGFPINTVERIPADSVVVPNPVATPPTGTPIHPGESFQAKVDAAPAGTVFIVKVGTHRMQRVTPKAGQSFIGEAGAILNGAKVLTSPQGSGPWYYTGQTQSDAGVSTTRCATGYSRCDSPHDVFIDGVLQRHVESLGAVGPGSFFFDFGADRIYIGTNPSGKLVEVSDTRHAFLGSASGVTIRGLVIEKYANRAQLGAIAGNTTDGWVVEDNVIRLNHGVGIRIGHRMRLRNNKVLRNGQMGVGGIGDDVLVEGNEIAYNNTVGYRAGWEAGGTKFVRTHRLVVRGNFAHHNAGPGLWTDISNYHTLYENNRSEDNRGPGIFHEISFDAVIRNNRVRRNGVGDPHPYKEAGIRVSNSENVTVTGNIVEDNDNGIIGMQQVRIHGGVDYKLKNLKVTGNTIRMSMGFTGIVRDDGDNGVFDSYGNQFSSNTYFVNTSKTNWWTWVNGSRGWSAWQRYGQDSKGKVIR